MPRQQVRNEPRSTSHRQSLAATASVGGRIVAETLIGLLRADPTSYLNVIPDFRPCVGLDLTLGPAPNPAITGDLDFTRAHFLHCAGVATSGVYR